MANICKNEEKPRFGAFHIFNIIMTDACLYFAGEPGGSTDRSELKNLAGNGLKQA